MTFKDYYKLTIPTTKSCLKLNGIIFTVCFVIIWIISGETDNMSSFSGIIEMILLLFLLGNAFGLFITACLLIVRFIQHKADCRFYMSIPFEIKEQYLLNQYIIKHRYDYLKFGIRSFRPGRPFLIFDELSNLDLIRITVLNKSVNDDINALKQRISKKYGSDQIEFLGFGLARTIKCSKFKKLTSSEIENIIDELITICRNEGMEIAVVSES